MTETINDVLEVINALRAAGVEPAVNIEISVYLDPGIPEEPEDPEDPEEPEEPEPPTGPEIPAGINIFCKVDKSNMRCAPNSNAAGKPIFQIYPTDSSPVSQRKQVFKNEPLYVYGTPVTGDGGTQCWKVIMEWALAPGGAWPGEDLPQLYALKGDFTKSG